MKTKKSVSTVITLHYIRLVYRSILFVLLAITYVRYRLFREATVIESAEKMPAIIYFTWAVFVMKSGSTDIDISDNNSTVLVALIWIVFNGIFGALHMVGILDDGIMILLCSAYSICDIICILFFCPFQTWFMKNKCCSTCRIYNWDYAMMFTPLFFVRKTYTWSLLALSVALLFRWEITFYLHPERPCGNRLKSIRPSGSRG